MPLLFGILTALVLAISTWIGIKNQAEYKKQIGYRQVEEVRFDKEVKKLKMRTDEWLATIDAKEVLIASNVKLTDEIATLESSIAAIKSEIAQKEAKKKQLEMEVAAATEVMDKVGGVRALVPKIRGLRSDIATLKSQIEEGNATLSNLKQEKADTRASITVNEERVEFETTGKSQPFLSTSIKTVYSSWGFVTLNGGDIQGVVPGSTLSVVRGDEVVAKLKVTTVEPNRAAADILIESIATDVILMGGDKVVAESITDPVDPAKKVTAN
jgi:predicted  nucleic acid-binding Zn-ribbon protein